MFQNLTLRFTVNIKEGERVLGKKNYLEVGKGVKSRVISGWGRHFCTYVEILVISNSVVRVEGPFGWRV